MFTVESNRIVGLSSLNIINDICSICRNNLNDKCIICDTDEKKDNCYSVLGTCGHGYHYHCIKQWLDKKNNRCPLDYEYWSYVIDKKKKIN
jgi:hypothetical protein